MDPYLYELECGFDPLREARATHAECKKDVLIIAKKKDGTYGVLDFATQQPPALNKSVPLTYTPLEPAAKSNDAKRTPLT